MFIRSDVCVTLEVPDGTVIDEEGVILLPDGETIGVDALAERRTNDGEGSTFYGPGCDGPLEHVYYATPVVVDERYEGDDSC